MWQSSGQPFYHSYLMENISFKKILIYIVFGVLNLLGTKSFSLGLLFTIFEYLVVLTYIVIGQNYKALIAFLAFTSLSLEIDAYIYLNGEGLFARYHFLNPPYIGELLYDSLTCLLYVLVYRQYKQDINNSGTTFIKWLWVLGLTGAVSIFVGIALNNHQLINTGWYPKLAFSLLFKYIAFVFFCISFYYIAISNERNRLESDVLSILVGVTVVGVLSVVFGYHGYYGQNENIMLAPLAICFCPTLLIFSNGRHWSNYFIISLVIVLFFLSLGHSIVIGSKWYIILAFTIIYLICKKLSITSIWTVLFVSFVILLLLPVLADTLKSLLNLSEFNGFKLDQSIRFLNIFSNDSIYDWFINLDESARFRIDEPINIMQDYVNSPGYGLMGKGFGGVIPHYTSFCIWDTPSAFTEDQRKFGLYYSMHETFSVLFLRHGVLGIVFFITVLVSLFKRWNSQWFVFGLIWFLFYWSFGISFRIGAVALILAVTAISSNSKVDG